LIPVLTSLLRVLFAISPGTANLLAYSMLVVVAIFLVSGPIIVYIFYKKNKREQAAAQPNPA
jgi:preprotein translocase subunit SecG